jgi:hypothetical protein
VAGDAGVVVDLLTFAHRDRIRLGLRGLRLGHQRAVQRADTDERDPQRQQPGDPAAELGASPAAFLGHLCGNLWCQFGATSGGQRDVTARSRSR